MLTWSTHQELPTSTSNETFGETVDQGVRVVGIGGSRQKAEVKMSVK